MPDSEIKGILFDKDGTIIDFYNLWLPVIESVAADIIEKLAGIEIETQPDKFAELNGDMMEIFGVCTETEEIDPDGNLAQASVNRCARELADYLLDSDLGLEREKGELVKDIIEIMESAAGGAEFEKNLQETADLDYLFRQIKNEGYYLGMATADSRPSTLTILKELEVIDYFDYIACGDDDIPDKPDPTVIENFCEKFDLTPEEVAYVGDTPVDMQTASSGGAGLIIGVVCGVGRKEDLESKADVILPDPSEILRLLDNN